MRQLLLTCLLALVVTFATAAWAQDKRFTHPLYPLQVGHQWTYRSGKETVVIRVEKEVPIDITRNEKKERVISFTLKIGSGRPRTMEWVGSVPIPRSNSNLESELLWEPRRAPRAHRKVDVGRRTTRGQMRYAHRPCRCICPFFQRISTVSRHLP